MTEKKFYLESKIAPLQEIGMRAQIISFLIANGIKDGNALNDLQNEKKVIVAIRADDEKKIEHLKDDLVAYLNRLNKNEFCYGDFPNDIVASKLQELNNPHSVIILPLADLSNSLMLEQTSKGVGAMKYLADSIKPLHSLKDLPKIMNKLIKKVNQKD